MAHLKRLDRRQFEEEVAAELGIDLNALPKPAPPAARTGAESTDEAAEPTRPTPDGDQV